MTATEQSLGGEDFAWMLRQVPGAMARLGVRPAGQAGAPDIHQPTFDVDEECIRVGVATLAAVASRRGTTSAILSRARSAAGATISQIVTRNRNNP